MYANTFDADIFCLTCFYDRSQDPAVKIALAQKLLQLAEARGMFDSMPCVLILCRSEIKFSSLMLFSIIFRKHSTVYVLQFFCFF